MHIYHRPTDTLIDLHADIHVYYTHTFLCILSFWAQEEGRTEETQEGRREGERKIGRARARATKIVENTHLTPPCYTSFSPLHTPEKEQQAHGLRPSVCRGAMQDSASYWKTQPLRRRRL